MLNIDLSEYHQFLDITTSDNKQYIFDPIRKRKFVLLPEEMVRQTWICYLNRVHGIAYASLGVEKQIITSGMSKRYDLVYYRKGKPHLLFEFKSFKIKLSDQTAFQAADYNMALRVPYMVLSNGLSSFLYEIDFENKKVREIADFRF